MANAAFYQDMVKVVDEALREFGKEYVLRSFTGSTYFPATGKNLKQNSDVTCKAAIFPISQSHINEVKTRFGDMEAYISALNLSTVPKEGDQLIEWAEGTAWTVSGDRISFSTDGKIADLDAGFTSAKVGENITIAGSDDNDGSYTVTDVSSDGASIYVYPLPTGESAGADITIEAVSISTLYNVIVCEPLKPAGITVYYLIFLREINQ